MENSPKIDCQVSAVPINRYLVKTKTTKYNRSQKVESVKHRYFFQWQNALDDCLSFFVHPFQTYQRVAISLASMAFFLRGREDMAQLVFVVGALTLDVAVESNNTTSFSVTVAANSNRMMIMGFGHYQGGDNISGATYAAAALSEIKAQPGSYGERAGLWGKVAPATGANTFAISGNDSWSGYGVVSIYDVDQNLPTNTAGASGDSGYASTTVTTTVDNAWVVAAFGCEPTPTMDSGIGGSPVEDMNEQGASYQNAEMHHNPVTTASTAQQIGCDLSYGARWNVAACEVKPAGGGGGGPTPTLKDPIGMGVVPFARV